MQIDSLLPSVGNEGRVKEQLIEQFREIPNPKEEELAKFSTVIKEHESLMNAREYKVVAGRTVGRVLDDPPKPVGKPHFLCGNINKRNECTQQGSGCKKFGSHLEENCWTPKERKGQVQVRE